MADDQAALTGEADTLEHPTEWGRRALVEFKADSADPVLRTTWRGVSFSETSVDMAVRAGTIAIRNAGMTPGSVGAVLVSEQCPDRPGYCSAMAVAHGLGLDEGAAAMRIDAQCASAVAQIDLACGMIATGQARAVLCIQTHVLGRTFESGDTPWIYQFGDMATAVIVAMGRRNHIVDVEHAIRPEFADATVWRRHDDSRSWFEGGERYRVGSLLARERVASMLPEVVGMQVRQIRGLQSRHEFAAYVGNQPRGWIGPLVAKTCEIPAIVQTFESWAHVGACGAVVNLAALLGMHTTSLHPHVRFGGQGEFPGSGKVAMVQLGAGLRCSTVVIEV